MEKIEYSQFGEVLYRTKLANGLTVNLVPKTNYHKTYAILTTNYGAINRTFSINEQGMKTYPAGVAHFLEHKMFDQPGYDAFELFSKYGADCNAFTSYTRTSYLFSTTSHVLECLTGLLDFVQEPYFIKASVEKEKGIIDQEIQMYRDNPGWVLYSSMIGNLYPGTPLTVDIAGSSASIREITTEDLMACYQAFYQPNNMNLFVVGNFEVEQVIDTLNKNQAQKAFPTDLTVTNAAVNYYETKIIPHSSQKMEVQRPKTMIGLKGVKPLPTGRRALAYNFKVEILLELLFGETSQNYLKLYDEAIIDDSFDFEFVLEKDFYFATIYSDTDQPELFIKAITEILQTASISLTDQAEHFELVKKELIGRLINSLNSLESIANNYEGALFDDAVLFDIIPLIEEMNFTDVLAVGQDFIDVQNLSVAQILPK